jgi:tetratricopeptide (TPR) repeat protein
MMRHLARGALIALFLGLGTLVAGCEDVPTRVERHYGKGMERLAGGDPEGAKLEFRSALRLNENHAPSRFEIARLYEADGEVRAALGNYRLVTELDPAHLPARKKLAEMLLVGGQAEQAAVFIDQAVALAPQDPAVLELRAALAQARGDATGAAEAARASLAVDPDAVTAQVVLLSQRFQSGDRQGAREALDAELARRPEEPTLNLLKLAFLELDGDTAGIGAHLTRLVALMPGEDRYAAALIEHRVRTGDLAGAEQVARARAEAAPADSARALDVVRLAGIRGGPAAAEAELERLIAAGQGPLATYEMALAEIEAGTGRVDAAVARLERLVASGTDAASVAEGRHRLAFLALARGDRAAARAEIEAALKADATHTGALRTRAGLALVDDLPEAAIADLRRAAQLDPRNPDIMRLEAEAQARAGNREIAVERLAAATQAADHAPDAALAYADALIGRGQTEGAETVLATSAGRHPGDRRVLLRLAQTRLALQRWADVPPVAEALRATGSPGHADLVLAALAMGRGQLDDSLARLRRLAEDPAMRREALPQYVRALVATGATEQAAAVLEAAVAENPADTVSLAMLAELRQLKGDPAAAETHARNLATTVPASPEGHLQLVRLLLARGDVAGAEQAARAGVAAARPPEPVRLALARILEQKQDWDGAIAEYEAVHEALAGQSLPVANNLASLIAEHRAGDKAALERALRIAARLRGQTLPAFRDTYGWVLFLNGQTSQALPELEAAAAGLPDESIVQYHLGRVYLATNQTGKARERLARALELDPAFPKAASARTALEALPPPPVGQ